MAAEPASAVFRALLPLVAALDGLGLRYAITGSLASSLHGETRATRDADVVVHLDASTLGPLLDALSREFYVPRDLATRAVEAGRSFNVIHLESQYKIDLYPASGSRLGPDLVERRVKVHHPSAPGRELCFASAEAIVLAKLDWFHRGGGTSEQQWRDVIGVLKVQGERLDRVLLQRRAAELDLTDLLTRALSEAGLLA